VTFEHCYLSCRSSNGDVAAVDAEQRNCSARDVTNPRSFVEGVLELLVPRARSFAFSPNVQNRLASDPSSDERFHCLGSALPAASPTDLRIKLFSLQQRGQIPDFGGEVISNIEYLNAAIPSTPMLQLEVYGAGLTRRHSDALHGAAAFHQAKGLRKLRATDVLKHAEDGLRDLSQIGHYLVCVESPEPFAARGATNHSHDMRAGVMCELDGESTDTP
jgi:hypothetical protein